MCTRCGLASFQCSTKCFEEYPCFAAGMQNKLITTSTINNNNNNKKTQKNKTIKRDDEYNH